MRVIALIALATLSAACSSGPRTADSVAAEVMTIDALEWAETPTERRLYLRAQLVECESADELKAFSSAADRRFELVADDSRAVELRCGTGGRTVLRSGRTSCSIMLFPRHPDWQPRPGVRYRLVPRNSSSDHHWVVIEGLTTPTEGD